MEKIIILFYCLLGFSMLAFSNPMPAPRLYITELKIQSKQSWSLTLDAHQIYDSQVYFDSIYVIASTKVGVYDFSKYSKSIKESIAAGQITLTNDSLRFPIDINPESTSIIVEVFISNKTFPNLENFDTLSIGSNSTAMFPSLTPKASIKRDNICGAYYSLYYDDGNSSDFTLKGIAYDKLGNPLKNAEFVTSSYYNYSGTAPCTFGVFTTNDKGEYQTTQTCSNKKYVRTGFDIYEQKYLHYFKIENINIRAVPDTIVICDIHLLDDYVSVPEIKNGFSLYPNPASSQATLKYDLATVDNATVEVLDIAGNVVERFPLQSTTGILQLQLGSKYSAGMYVVQVKSGSTLLYSQDLIVNK